MDWDWIHTVSELRGQGIPFSIVTVCDTLGSTPREVGAKMIVIEDGSIRGTIGGGQLEHQAIQQAIDCIKARQSKRVKYPLGAKVGQCCGGSVELMFETIERSPALYVFGAGHVGQAVCTVMDGTGFRLHLIDDRPEFAQSPLVSSTVTRHCCEWDHFVDGVDWDPNLSFAVVMTHRHDLDEKIIQDLMNRPLKYIGLIGSSAKWTRFRQRYEARGVSDQHISRVKCPIGDMPLGKSPKAVAISLAAELLTLERSNHTTGPHAGRIQDDRIRASHDYARKVHAREIHDG